MKPPTSIEKAASVLDRLAEPPYTMSLTEVADFLSMSKPGALSMLDAMEQCGFVFRDSLTKRYTLGASLVRLGKAFLEQSDLENTVMPHLVRLKETTPGGRGHTYLSIWDGRKCFLLLSVDFLHDRRTYGPYEGGGIPLHAGLTAILLAAYQDQAMIRRMLEAAAPLKKVTENTLTDIDQIMEHYRRVREQGYHLGNEGYRIGFVGIAAPVFDKDGRAFAAVALSCPKTLLSREALVENYLDGVLETARVITRKIALRG